MGEVHFDGIEPPFEPGVAEEIEAAFRPEQAAAQESAGTGHTGEMYGSFGLETVYNQCLSRCGGDEDAADIMFSELLHADGMQTGPPPDTQL